MSNDYACAKLNNGSAECYINSAVNLNYVTVSILSIYIKSICIVSISTEICSLS